jgi:hypothetical protein
LPARSAWFATLSVITCSVWLTACAPGILGSKDEKEKIPRNASASDRSSLTKPVIPKDRAFGSQSRQDVSGAPRVASGNSSGALPAPAKGVKDEKPSPERVSSSQNGLGKDIPDSSRKQRGQRSSEIQESGASIRTAVADIHGDPKTSGKSGSDTSAKDDLPFKRHDHKKYVQKIRNKAIDKVNKTRDVTYATLCRDSATDEWSLWIYKFEGKTYRFITYAWDEVDEKWEESLKSNKQPVSGWKRHLKFTADTKRCQKLVDKRH